MQCTVDFEHTGNTANQLIHLVNKHDKTQLNFELNLRGYKNKSPFKAAAPWQYPETRNFSPEHQLKDKAEKAAGSNYDSKKNLFIDKFNETNLNAL